MIEKLDLWSNGKKIKTYMVNLNGVTEIKYISRDWYIINRGDNDRVDVRGTWQYEAYRKIT